MWHVYRIRLSNHKHFVGVQKAALLPGLGSDGFIPWLKMHQPIGGSIIVRTYDNHTTALSYAKQLTEKMMSLYGIANVRGVGYTAVHLDPNIHTPLLSMLQTQYPRNYDQVRTRPFKRNRSTSDTRKSALRRRSC